MFFFAFMTVVTAAAAAFERAVRRRAVDWPWAMRIGLSAALLFFGTDHLVTPGRYLPMMPGFVPWPREVVLFTGLCEMAGAIGLLIPGLRRLAGIMLAIYFVAVFPANIKNAIDGLSVEGLPAAGWYYWVRLLFQPLAIWWSLHAARVIGRERTGAGEPPGGPAGRLANP